MFVFSTSRPAVAPIQNYFQSQQGILRIVEAVISLIGIICYSQTDYCSRVVMFNFVVVTTLILSIFIIVAHHLESIEKLTFNRLVVFINDVVFAILYLIVTIFSFTTIGECFLNKGQSARTAQAIFSLAGTLVVAYLALLGYQEMKVARSNPSPDAVVVEPNSAPAANQTIVVPQNKPAEPFVLPMPKVRVNFNVPVRI